VKIYPNLGSIEIGSRLLPSGSYDLGSSSYKWQNLYLSGSIYVDGNVDGVDVSAHAANASAHHTKTSNISEVTIDVDKDWNIKDISNVKYLKFNSTYGQIYWGTDLLLDIYAAYTNYGKHFYPVTTAAALNLGTPDQKWNYYYGATSACDLPTKNSAIDLFKQLPAPVLKEGHFGKQQYFEEEKMPKEFRWKDVNTGKEPMEGFHTLGLCVQAIRELTKKVRFRN